tara:strand:+ start:94 stop:297 length:204 start_codon:yes stop_codon:yes gene_type:complete
MVSNHLSTLIVSGSNFYLKPQVMLHLTNDQYGFQSVTATGAWVDGGNFLNGYYRIHFAIYADFTSGP